MGQRDGGGRAEKLIRVVCEKMGQLVPQMLNCLVIATEGGAMTEDEVNTAMKSLKRRVEQREGERLSGVGLDTSSEFFKQFQWLNEIVLCSFPEQEAVQIQSSGQMLSPDTPCHPTFMSFCQQRLPWNPTDSRRSRPNEESDSSHPILNSAPSA